MNGLLTGSLVRQRGSLSFTYADSWLASPHGRPISLSLPMSAAKHSGDVVSHYFDNLLPDNPDVRTRLSRQFGLPSSSVFDLLSAVGRDCVGAVRIAPPGDIGDGQIQADPISDEAIAEALRTLGSNPLGMSGIDDDFRLSIAGAQEKTAFTLIDRQWHRPSGETPTTHIFKLPIGPTGHFGPDLSDSVENEWLCLKLLGQFGLNVPAARIGEFDGVKALVVERFDRRWQGSTLVRLPQEDMCQALGASPDHKYESDGGPGIKPIMDLLLGSRNSADDRIRFFQAMVLNWLLAAPDGHAKNYSIQLFAGGTYQLTPFYDVVSVYPYFPTRTFNPKKQRMAMAALGKNKHYRWSDIRARHWISTGEKIGFSHRRATELLEELLVRVPDVVSQTATTLPAEFPDRVAEPILDGLSKLAREASAA